MAAGYEEDVVLGYERDDLMSLYDVLASGKPKAGPVGYDPELERKIGVCKGEMGNRTEKMGSRNGGKKG